MKNTHFKLQLAVVLLTGMMTSFGVNAADGPVNVQTHEYVEINFDTHLDEPMNIQGMATADAVRNHMVNLYEPAGRPITVFGHNVEPWVYVDCGNKNEDRLLTDDLLGQVKNGTFHCEKDQQMHFSLYYQNNEED